MIALICSECLSIRIMKHACRHTHLLGLTPATCEQWPFTTPCDRSVFWQQSHTCIECEFGIRVSLILEMGLHFMLFFLTNKKWPRGFPLTGRKTARDCYKMRRSTALSKTFVSIANQHLYLEMKRLSAISGLFIDLRGICLYLVTFN